MSDKRSGKWFDCVLEYSYGNYSKDGASYKDEGKGKETFSSASLKDAKETAGFFLKHRAAELMIAKKFLLDGGMKSNRFTHASLTMKKNGGRGKKHFFLLNYNQRNFGKVSFSGSLFTGNKHWG